MASLESNYITYEMFGMISSMGKNYQVASHEIEGVFDTNAIHCKEAKHYTSNDSEKSKY